MKMVYICSPLRGTSSEEREENIFKALIYSKWATESLDVIPLAPHTIFTQYLDDCDIVDRAMAIEMAHELLLRCDELWVFGSVISEGMREELGVASDNDIYIRFIDEADVFEGENYE